jgi:hypothetical protein
VGYVGTGAICQPFSLLPRDMNTTEVSTANDEAGVDDVDDPDDNTDAIEDADTEEDAGKDENEDAGGDDADAADLLTEV